MTIRKIISLVESVAPSIEDIEADIVHEADEAAVSDSPRLSGKMTFFDRNGNARPHYAGRDLDDMAMEGWASVTFMDDWRVAVKLDGRKVTRAALDSAIKAVESTQAGDIRIEDKSSRIPARYSGWTREGGLGALKGLLRKIKLLRAIGGEPDPTVLNRGMAPVAENVALDEAYLLELSEMSNTDLEESMEDWRARFRQAYDRESKDEAGFERACDKARLTKQEREMAREDVSALAEGEDEELDEMFGIKRRQDERLEMAKSSDPLERIAAVKHTANGLGGRVHRQVCDLLVNDPDPLVRRAVASYGEDAHVKQLTRDPDSKVSQTALRVLRNAATGPGPLGLGEGRHGTVPASMLGNMKRWDAEHVLDVKDEVEARGGDLSNAEDTKSASDDIAFADRALPDKPRKTAIRGLKENGMVVIEDDVEEEEILDEAWFDTLAKNGKKDDTPASEEPEKEEAVEEGALDVMSRVLATGMSDEEIIRLLDRAQISRQAAKMSHVKPQKSLVPGWGDGLFYTKEEHTLVMKVFKNFKKLHTRGRKNEAIMQDFDRYARKAGYHGPRPILAPDGINAHLKEDDDAGRWLPWNGGGKNPAPGQKVMIRRRDGEERRHNSDLFDWKHTGAHDDIVEYMPLQGAEVR